MVEHSLGKGEVTSSNLVKGFQNTDAASSPTSMGRSRKVTALNQRGASPDDRALHRVRTRSSENDVGGQTNSRQTSRSGADAREKDLQVRRRRAEGVALDEDPTRCSLESQLTFS